jgi:signal transduction histidine kinase
MKNEFISTVSHELRTPLTSISGALGLMTHSMLGSLPDKAQGIVSIAYKNSQRLAVLINDLLDMEKLLAGKMYFDSKTQLALPLVEQVVQENQAYADGYGVSLLLHDQAPGARVNVDAFRLQQVLNNFLSNAAKYSPRNGHVDINLQRRDGWLRVFVRDYGSGIPAEFRARIFQKFSQADATDSRQKGGTGLGLAISKELVERMGGHIGFDSEPGQGSCFFAEFPLQGELESQA